MIINISAVSGRREASFDFQLNEKLGDEVLGADGAVFTTPVSLEGEVIKEQDIYYVEGTKE